MAALDFSAPCAIAARDEFGDLSQSLNTLSADRPVWRALIFFSARCEGKKRSLSSWGYLEFVPGANDKEYELLHFLMTNPEQIFSREQLLNRVWGYDFEDSGAEGLSNIIVRAAVIAF